MEHYAITYVSTGGINRTILVLAYDSRQAMRVFIDSWILLNVDKVLSISLVKNS